MIEKSEAEKAQYKAEVKKRLESLKVGNDDFSGDKIEHIFGRGDEHVIYKIYTPEKFISASLMVYIDTFDEDDEKGVIDNFDAIRPFLDEFRSVVHLSSDVINSMQRAANAVTAAIKGNIDSAQKMFENIIDSIRDSHIERLKFKGIFLSSYIILVIVLSVVSVLVYFCKNLEFIRLNIEVMYLLFMGTCGVLGGFISVSTKLNILSFEHKTPPWQIVLHAFERACYSFVLGIIGYFLVKNDMLFAFVKNSSQPLYGYLICCCIAGLSERFIPDKLVELQKRA